MAKTSAQLVFIDSCDRLDIPVDMAAVVLKESRWFVMENQSMRIRWMIDEEGWSMVMIRTWDKTGCTHLVTYCFRPDGSQLF